MNKIVTFSSAVDASQFIAGGDTGSIGFGLLDIAYEDPAHYRGQVQNGDSTFAPQVVAINVDSPSEANAAADIRSAIAATLS